MSRSKMKMQMEDLDVTYLVCDAIIRITNSNYELQYEYD